MSTQLFVPKFRVDEVLEQIKECLDKGWTGLGFKTIEIEEKWKVYTGLKHAHFLSSNTVGLHLALEVFKRKDGWFDGDEVITTPLTFISSNHAILYSGLTPVFADVDDTLCLDPDSIIAKITDRTKAVMFVGIGGNVGQLDRVIELCKSRNIRLILDAAHMAGTRVNGNHVGAEADAAVFSFQAVKNLPTADSGMICFRDQEDDVRVRKLSWLGINKDTFARANDNGSYKWLYDVEELGYKYHGNSVMASMAIVGLKYLDVDNAYRRQLVEWYREELADVEGVEFISKNENCESSSHLFQIVVEDREKLIRTLNENDIYPGVHYRSNIEYQLYERPLEDYPKATYFSQRILSLPMHQGVTKAEVEKIAKIISTAVRNLT